MKKVGIIARRRIVDCHTHLPLDDKGLKALDSYHEDILFVDEKAGEIDVFTQFKDLHPDLMGWDLELIDLER